MPEPLAVISADDVEAAASVPEDKLELVRSHARSLYQKRREATRKLEEAKKLAEEIEILETKTLPDAMRDIKMRHFGLEGGFEIELEDVVHGGIKKENEEAAFGFLKGNAPWDAIIKNSITVYFDKGEEKWADKFMKDLAKRKRPLEVERKAVIHAGTLKKFIKERVAEEKKGAVPPEKVLPRDVFSVFEFTRANLIDPAEEARKNAEKLAKPKKPKAGPKPNEVEM
jgi:hypothetical protein